MSFFSYDMKAKDCIQRLEYFLKYTEKYTKKKAQFHSKWHVLYMFPNNWLFK